MMLARTVTAKTKRMMMNSDNDDDEEDEDDDRVRGLKHLSML